MSTSIKLTQSAVKGLPFVQADDKKRQHLYFDTDLKGLGVCVGAALQARTKSGTTRTGHRRASMVSIVPRRTEPARHRAVTARSRCRCAAANTASTGRLSTTFPAITMCQRTPAPGSRRSAIASGSVRT